MAPFSHERALTILREELFGTTAREQFGEGRSKKNGDDPDLTPLVGPRGSGAPFVAFSECPVGAASLGQVYRGTLADGREVAVKVQRPDVYTQVGLDMYIVRGALAWLKEYWQTDTDIPAVADQVGAGLLRELDYRLEAANADAFAKQHAFLPFVRVPANVPELSGRKVMVSEWIDGRPLRDCTETEKLGLVRMGLESSVAQLLQTGMIHADPHEGNFLLDDEGKLVMLDFGLVTQMDPGHQEAMAGCVLAFINEDYDEMIVKFKGMGVLPEQPQRWIDGRWVDCTFEDFRGAFLTALFASDNDEGFKPTDMTNFGDLWIKLGTLALEYAFIIPSYYILVMRSFATFEGIAETVDGDFDIYSAAMPYAARRALAPTTPEGFDALKAALVDDKGALRVDRLSAAVPKRGRRGSAPRLGSSSAAAPAAEVLTTLLLEERDGRAFRRVLLEVDTLAAARYALSPAGLDIVRVAASAAVAGCWRRARGEVGGRQTFERQNEVPEPSSSTAAASFSPTVAALEAGRLQRRGAWRRRRVLSVLVRTHVTRLLRRGGLEGKMAAAMLAVVAAWTGLATFFREFFGRALNRFRSNPGWMLMSAR